MNSDSDDNCFPLLVSQRLGEVTDRHKERQKVRKKERKRERNSLTSYIHPPPVLLFLFLITLSHH